MNTEVLLERLRQGTSIDELIAETAPAIGPPKDLQVLWQRASLVRAFDQSLYDTVLARGLDVPRFDAFVKRAGIEALPDGVSFYVGEDARARGFAAWKSDRAGLPAFSEELVDFYLKRSSPVDVFTHRIFAAPGDALRDLETLYGEADDRFDLAACSALLLLVRNRLELLDPGSPFRSALRSRERYLDSRTLFSDEYYRTVSYLRRDPLEQAAERFLSGSKTWVLHVYGKGGTGKTMFVRWLVARRCVKELDGRRIPVALLDFDRLDLSAFARAPWLVLHAIAEQLDPQLETGLLLSQTRRLAPLLQRGSRDTLPSAERKQRDEEAKRAGLDAEPAFISRLGASPVVIVLDTLEEPLLHYKAATRRVLELFARIRAGCEGFRVVLSGRYNIADRNRLPATAHLLEGEVEFAPVAEFDAEESTRYLRDLRRIERDAAVLAAVHTHTRGNPLELSLFAELLAGDPTLTTPAQIKEVYPIARFARLLERIIDRIPPNQEVVRWLLRYAVVPRTFTRRYFDNVLARYMPREVAGTDPLDDANRFGGALAPRYRGRRFWTHRTRQPKYDRVWKQLEQYAATASWVTSSGDGLHLQPELTGPMRDLLQQQSEPMFRTLHRASAAYYADLARHENVRWHEHIAEAIYHRFQLGGTKAIPYFKRQLADSRAKDPIVRERLASVLLEAEFVDPDTLRPRPHYRTGVIVDRETCAGAAFEVCVAALLQRLRMPRKDPDAQASDQQIADYHRKLQRLLRGARSSVVSAHRQKLVEGGAAIYADQLHKGADLVRAALAGERRRDLRLLGELLLAVPIGVGVREDDRRFRSARNYSVASRAAYLAPAWIEYRWGLRHLERFDFVTAARHLDQACRAMAAPFPHAPEVADALRRAVQAYLETGDHTEARRLLDFARRRARAGNDAELQVQQLISGAQLALAQFDIARAQGNVASLEKTAAPRQAGIVAELKGDLASAVLQTHDMETSYLAATNVYEAGSLRGQMNCHLKRARYYLEALEHGPTAATFLAQTSESQDPWTPVETYVLAARLASLTQSRLRFSRRGMRLTAAQMARAGAGTLAAGSASPPQITEFLSALARVDHAPTRAEILREFSGGTRRAIATDVSRARRLRRLVTLDPARDEYAVHAYHLAAALQCFGDDETARTVLKQGLKRAKRTLLSEKMRRALAIIERHPVPRIEAAFPSSMTWRGLSAAILLEDAERCFAQVDFVAAQGRLNGLEPEITSALGTDSVWHIRCLDLSGKLAERDGRGEAAMALFQSALESAQRSQNKRAEPRLKDDLARARRQSKAAPPRIELRSPSVTIRLQLRTTASPGFDATTILPDGSSGIRHPGLTTPNPLVPALLSSSTAYSQPLLNLLRDRTRLLAGVRDIMGEVSKAPALDVAIAADRLTSCLPWELAFDPQADRCVYRASEDTGTRDTVVWIQSVLAAIGHSVCVDGGFGPQTQARLAAEVSPALLAAPRQMKAELRRKATAAGLRGSLFIVSADLEEDRRRGRGHGKVGLNVTDLYKERISTGAPIRVYRTDPRGLRGNTNNPPTLIHVVTGFLEATRTREIFLDIAQLGPLPSSNVSNISKVAGGVRATASYLKSVLEELPRSAPPPFLIIEAIHPNDEYELARQILLRNEFCTDLFAFTRTRGILATGFFSGETLLGRYKDFIALVGTNPSAGELHNFVWNLPAAFPPALFTVDPDLSTLR